jgi:hypothetical protein
MVRLTPHGGLWAIPSFNQGLRGLGDAPADDVTVLRVEDGKTSVVATMAVAHNLPADLPREWYPVKPYKGPGWTGSHPAWIADSDTLVYQHGWSVHTQGQYPFPRDESLYVSELWARPLKGKPILLAMNAAYNSARYYERSKVGGETPLRWSTGPNGRLVEHKGEERDDAS